MHSYLLTLFYATEKSLKDWPFNNMNIDFKASHRVNVFKEHDKIWDYKHGSLKINFYPSFKFQKTLARPTRNIACLWIKLDIYE